MANKYLKRRFTVRETVLLCVLLVVLLLGLYFGLVFYPIHSRTAKLDRDLNQAAIEKQAMDDRKETYDRMKKELADIEANHDSTRMPQYNNNAQLTILTDTFNAILRDVLFDSEQNFISDISSQPSNGVYIRTVTINFTVDEAHKRAGDATVFDTVRAVLTDLITTEYRSSMLSLTLRPDEEGLQGEACNSIGVTVVIEFFELA